MKVIRQPIDVIAWFNAEGVIMPIRFRLEAEDHTLRTVKINNVVSHKSERLAGIPTITYTCLIDLNGIEITCEIKYNLDTCKWILFKI